MSEFPAKGNASKTVEIRTQKIILKKIKKVVDKTEFIVYIKSCV